MSKTSPIGPLDLLSIFLHSVPSWEGIRPKEEEKEEKEVGLLLQFFSSDC